MNFVDNDKRIQDMKAKYGDIIAEYLAKNKEE
jgi:hypothetical protein